MLLVGGWLVAVSVARRQYVVTSRAEHQPAPDRCRAGFRRLVLDRSTSDLLAAKSPHPILPRSFTH